MSTHIDTVKKLTELLMEKQWSMLDDFEQGSDQSSQD